MGERYIVVWRRSPTSRSLDVQLDRDNKIAAFSTNNTTNLIIRDEDKLIEFMNSKSTKPVQVEANLAHSVLGWDIP
jgi:hypothetical protein